MGLLLGSSLAASASSVYDYEIDTYDYSYIETFKVDSITLPSRNSYFYKAGFIGKNNQYYKVSLDNFSGSTYSSTVNSSDFCSSPLYVQNTCKDGLGLKFRVIKSKDGIVDKPVFFIRGLSFSIDGGLYPDIDEFSTYINDYKLNELFTPLLENGKDIIFIEYNNDVPHHVGYVNFNPIFNLPSQKIYEYPFRQWKDIVPEEAIANVVHFINEKVKTGDYHNTLVGYSLGGVVGRRALNLMESKGYHHNFYNFISFDSPQRGANVLTSLQEILRRIKDRLEGIKGCSKSSTCDRQRKSMRAHVKRVSEGAASKLLVGGKDAYEYYRELDLDGYPKATYNVAFSNGSFSGSTHNIPSGTKLASFEVDYIIDGDTTYSLYSKNLSSSNSVYFNYNTSNYDNAPGSYSISGKELAAKIRSMDGVKLLSEPMADKNLFASFISTVSALDLDTTNLMGPHDLNTISTPFDRVYAVNGKNLSHTDFSYHRSSLLYEINKKENDTAALISIITSIL